MSVEPPGERAGFLTRWSRRKLEEPAQTRPAPAPEPVAETPEEPFDLTRLPDIESITAETDLSIFFSKGVPESLKNAALRRMWSTDPAIRDAVVPADFQWDFNAPDGVPGFGPIGSDVDVQAMLRGILGEKEPTAEPAPPTVAPAPSGADQPALADIPAPGLEPDGTGPAAAIEAQNFVSLSEPEKEPAATPEAEAGREIFPARRRHGGALPV